MYIYIYTYACVFMHHIYIYTYIYTYMYMCVCMYMYVYIRVYIYIHICMCMHICIRERYNNQVPPAVSRRVPPFMETPTSPESKSQTAARTARLAAAIPCARRRRSAPSASTWSSGGIGGLLSDFRDKNSDKM